MRVDRRQAQRGDTNHATACHAGMLEGETWTKHSFITQTHGRCLLYKATIHIPCLVRLGALEQAEVLLAYPRASPGNVSLHRVHLFTYFELQAT